MRRALLVLAALGIAGLAQAAAPPKVTVGSKAFPESWILGEALTTLARQAGASPIAHRSNLGGTEIVYQALRSGAIDAYPEYTGTIAEVLLHRSDRPPLDSLRAGLAPLGIAVGPPLGFNDGYGIAISRATATRLGVPSITTTIS